MALTQSTEVAAQATTGVLADKRYGKSIPVDLDFHITVATAPGTAPNPQIQTAPAGFKPTFVFFATDGLSISGGIGLNCRIGDAGDDDRLMADVDSDAAVQTVTLAAAAADYEYTADTPILLKMTAGKTPVVGQKIWGTIHGKVRQ